MEIASLGTSVGGCRLDKIESMEDNDANFEVVEGIKSPARSEGLFNAEKATVLPADADD